MRPGDSPAAEAEAVPAALTASDAIAGYDRMAAAYDLWARIAEGKSHRRAMEQAEVRDGERVLDVAVGTGTTFEHLLARNPGGLTVGLDASRKMLARARQRASSQTAPNALLRADCRAIPFAGSSFDVLLSAYLLDLLSLEDMEASVSEFHRVLRPGGRLVLVSMTHDGPLMRAWSWLYARRPGLVGGCRSITARPLVEDAGFVDVRREVVRQWGFPSEIVTAVRAS